MSGWLRVWYNPYRINQGVGHMDGALWWFYSEAYSYLDICGPDRPKGYVPVKGNSFRYDTFEAANYKHIRDITDYAIDIGL